VLLALERSPPGQLASVSRTDHLDIRLTITWALCGEVLLYTELSMSCIPLPQLLEEKGCPSFERREPPASQMGQGLD
jgi:hypothetical protein